MTKHPLVIAVALGAAPVSAHAVNVSPSGMGEVLIYPYYTVQTGHKTLISVVNTTERTKIVKVRFLEGRNSRDVLDFHLFLSPFDAWVASVQIDPEPCGGGFGEGLPPCDDNKTPANIFTPDQSCTIGDIFGAGTSGKDFVNFAYSGDFDDNGGTDLSRTREGYLQVFEMGEIDTETEAGALLAAAADHETGVDCAKLRNAYFGLTLDEESAEGVWNPFAGGDPDRYVTEPTGGLYGSWEIFRVTEGRAFAGDAVALNHFYDPEGLAQQSEHSLHFSPGGFMPNLNSGDQGGGSHIGRVFSDTAGTELVMVWQARFDESVDAVSAALMQHRLFNEFSINPVVFSNTDWVITFPTKAWYTDIRSGTGFGTLPPFTSEDFTTGPTPGKACERIRSEQWDREETQGSSTDEGFSPPPPDGGFRLCWEANVVSMGSAVSLLGSELVHASYPIASGFRHGHVQLDLGITEDATGFLPFIRALDSTSPVGGVLTRFYGLPVVGYAVIGRLNAGVGVGAAYTSQIDHRYSRCLLSGATLPNNADLGLPEYCR